MDPSLRLLIADDHPMFRAALRHALGAIAPDAQIAEVASRSALDSIATGSHAGVPATLYTDLPQNGEVWPDLLIRGGTLAIPGKPAARADLLVNFQDPLTETGGSIARVGDLADLRARRSIDASGLFVVPITHGTGNAHAHQPASFTPGTASYFHLSRDAQGQDIVWTLAGDVDPAQPMPVGRNTQH